MDGGAIMLALATRDDHPLPGEAVMGIQTDDIDAAVRNVVAAGGRSSLSHATTLTSVGPWCGTTTGTPWSCTRPCLTEGQHRSAPPHGEPSIWHTQRGPCDSQIE